jgi:predicted PhzF superfamily epimerase YddE/YHI9
MTVYPEINIFSVFVNEKQEYGNPVGIILDEKQAISKVERQQVAAKLGFSESVFIDNLGTGKVSIFNPIREVDFAGHALVGTAFYFSEILKKPIKFLECRGGQLRAWQENGLTWIRASLKNTPPWNFEELKNEASVKKLSAETVAPKQHTVVWAWENKDQGIIRARTFAPDWGIPEDEANGSGSMQLAVKLNQELVIHHGRGSVIYAKPADNGMAAVGGRVKGDKGK